MADLVADCPRCGAKKITFDLTEENLIGSNYGWQQLYEAFCICRHCNRSSIFVLSQKGLEYEKIIKSGLSHLPDAVNRYMKVEGFINIGDVANVNPPDYLPENILNVFKEATTCLSVQCFNAASTMFRLCIDLSTYSLLPKEDVDGLNSKTRRDLGLRLPWLFNRGQLSEDLRDLSICIKDDGNDGAHRGTLGKEDAEDLLDFTCAVLKRIYTEPQTLKLANERREKRKENKN